MNAANPAVAEAKRRRSLALQRVQRRLQSRMNGYVTVAWDIDDVMYPWYDLAHAASVKAKLGRAHEVTPTTWTPYEEYGVTAQEWWDVLTEVTHDGTLYDGEPLEGVIEAMQALDNVSHFEVVPTEIRQVLITARGTAAHGDAIQAHTVAWVVKHLVPAIRPPALHFAADKGAKAVELGVDYAIDDHPKNIQAYEAVGVRAALIDKPWNQDFDAAWRIHSVDEFVDTIIEEAA